MCLHLPETRLTSWFPGWNKEKVDSSCQVSCSHLHCQRPSGWSKILCLQFFPSAWRFAHFNLIYSVLSVPPSTSKIQATSLTIDCVKEPHVCEISPLAFSVSSWWIFLTPACSTCNSQRSKHECWPSFFYVSQRPFLPWLIHKVFSVLLLLLCIGSPLFKGRCPGHMGTAHAGRSGKVPSRVSCFWRERF